MVKQKMLPKSNSICSVAFICVLVFHLQIGVLFAKQNEALRRPILDFDDTEEDGEWYANMSVSRHKNIEDEFWQKQNSAEEDVLQSSPFRDDETESISNGKYMFKYHIPASLMQNSSKLGTGYVF